jgi:hypothetical protein
MTNTECSTSRQVILACNALSCFLVSLLLISEYIRERHKTFPSNMPFIFACIGFIVNVNFGIGGLVNFRQVTNFHYDWADPEPSKHDQIWTTICYTQAFVFQTGAFTMLMWYAMLTELLYKIIVLKVKVKTIAKSKNKYYAWGTILPLFSGVVGALLPEGYGPRSGGL